MRIDQNTQYVLACEVAPYLVREIERFNAVSDKKIRLFGANETTVGGKQALALTVSSITHGATSAEAAERRIHSIITGEQASISIEIADVYLLACGHSLNDAGMDIVVMPGSIASAKEMVAVHAEIKDEKTLAPGELATAANKLLKFTKGYAAEVLEAHSKKPSVVRQRATTRARAEKLRCARSEASLAA